MDRHSNIISQARSKGKTQVVLVPRHLYQVLTKIVAKSGAPLVEEW